MSWYRSADMTYVSLVIHKQVALTCMKRLGELGTVQFEDLQGDTSAFKREFTDRVRVCDEMEAVLAYFVKEMERFHIQPEDHGSFEDWLRQQEHANQAASGVRSARRPLVDFWRVTLRQNHEEYQQLTQARERHLKAYSAAIEELEVTSRMAEMHDMEAEVLSHTADPQEALSYLHMRDVMDAEAASRASARSSGSSGHTSHHDEDDGKATPLLGAPGGYQASAGGQGGEDGGLRFKIIAGTLLHDHKAQFERMVIRASRNQAYVRFMEPQQDLCDERGDSVEKLVFAVFFSAPSLQQRLRAVCSSYGASLYAVDEFVQANQEDGSARGAAAGMASASGGQAAVAAAVRRRVRVLRGIISENQDLLQRQRAVVMASLRDLSRHVRQYERGIKREKGAAHMLNRFVPAGPNLLRGQGWVVSDARAEVQSAVAMVHTSPGVHSAGQGLPFFFDDVPRPWPTEPTFFPTNKFTEVFQGVVDTYGTPRYKEINPALYTAATFPFLFGIMYGDVGHASLLFVASLLMVIFEKRLSRGNLGEIFEMMFHGRYMLLLMGIFAIYCGFVYNDIFSLTFSFFKSTWAYPEGADFAVHQGDVNNVYPFGLDPNWHVAENALIFANSLKMKMSVIFGVTQMVFGICLKGVNAVYFRSKVDFFFEFVPQLVLMVSLFGYMLFLIFYKWSIDWSNPPEGAHPGSIINLMIGILLTPGYVDESEQLFPGMGGVHLVVLALVFICVPLMLLPKPFILSSYHAAQEAGHGDHHDGQALLADEGAPFGGGAFGDAEEGGHAAAAAGAGGDPVAVAPAAGGGHEEHHSFGDLFIHQMIETIEFVLGSVSNTASYLRLWALSLAHSELAEVFWQKAMQGMLQSGGGGAPVGIVIGFALWAGVTLAVLCVMDVLECYLHVLRLHWVEFQNKFYKGDGRPFVPFSFKALKA